MGPKLATVILLLLIAATIGGMVYGADYIGVFDARKTYEIWVGKLPWLRDRLAPAAPLPQAEIAELEAQRVREKLTADWTRLKTTEDELKAAEARLNEERQRLSQWEGELERREKAMGDREAEFSNREKQYEQAVKYYTTMRPVDAAKILSQQDDILVMEVFRRMPERNVAAILAEMDPAVAGAIMRKMAR